MEIDWTRYQRVDGDDAEVLPSTFTSPNVCPDKNNWKEGIEADEEEAWEDDYDKKQKGSIVEVP